MTPSPACIALIQSFEKCALQVHPDLFAAYLPTPNDVPTIGWGSTGPDITMQTRWSQAECDERFAHDLAAFAAKVDALLHRVPTTQHQFDAMVSLAYNIGSATFSASTVLRDHRSGHDVEAAAAFSMWVRQKGVVLGGLVRRRHAEAALYLLGDAA